MTPLGTAVWMELELLTWDTDFARARKVALDSGSASTGARLWQALRLHPASIASPSSLCPGGLPPTV